MIILVLNAETVSKLQIFIVNFSKESYSDKRMPQNWCSNISTRNKQL